MRVAVIQGDECEAVYAGYELFKQDYMIDSDCFKDVVDQRGPIHAIEIVHLNSYGEAWLERQKGKFPKKLAQIPTEGFEDV